MYDAAASRPTSIAGQAPDTAGRLEMLCRGGCKGPFPALGDVLLSLYSAKQLPASAAIPTYASKLEAFKGATHGPSPHVPYDAAGAPPPSAATSEAQWIRLCTAAPYKLSLQWPAHEWLTANARWEMKKIWGKRA
ncbi:hypothetical protein M441DRAFT_42655 [Trichoderma asperellum CBS 433.97]|uniref:Uncharacterized protein n=1 Tax=Trichoderma asperellum (strain ATCC 204424 / CBS 433.97 / NBRC 101777) TaxID=1042311 RepID=A0A2T3ZQ55_TRIA4|nr:hypothetical protein M441DRAFT_42655 [Trichoderma asperellum CBS 433.97]PTB46914.1 hypothetical protein M441DRAFT_42655 [Trichoderma asperellum CBS 433.97]